MIDITGRQFIGNGRSGEGKACLQSHSAVGSEMYPVLFHEATRSEVEAAARQAALAYPVYRQLPAAARASFLDAIADELDALTEEHITEIHRETALPLPRLNGEKARTAGQMRLFATVLRRGDFHGARIDLALPNRQPAPRPDLRQMRIGIGPVAVFGASNFPLAFSVAGGDTASALAAGCPVVVKAHSAHLVTSEIVANAIGRAIARCNVPAGVFNMVYGGNDVSRWLVEAGEIRAVGFTGSLRGGRALFDIAAARPVPIPVFAEMSSVNPVIILPQAQARRGEEIARNLAASVTLGAGQLCTNPGLVLVLQTSETGNFVSALRDALQSHPSQPMLHRGILDSYQAATQRMSEESGVKTLVNGDNSTLAAPHLFKAEGSALLAGNTLVQEEIFGPCTTLIELATKAELLKALSGLTGQLSATLIGEDEELLEYKDVLSVLEEIVGRVLFNGFPTGVDVCDAMVHGGPYPATTDSRGTSVGSLAIDRFLRPVCYQNIPDVMLPPELQNANPLGLERLVNGAHSREPIAPSA